MSWTVAAIAATLVGYALVSGKLRDSPITAAIVFVTVGWVLGSDGLDLVGQTPDTAAVRALAEVTLTLVLFSDASSLDIRALRREAGLPIRLLAIGLPLTIVAGAALAAVLLPGLELFEGVVLAVLLAPTDAALGQTVVSDRRLPTRLRQGLNVESGLNDGVCVPLLFAAIAFVELEESPSFDGEILVDLVKEVLVAGVVGVVVAVVASKAALESRRRGWLDGSWAQVMPLAIAAGAYAVTNEVGGSGFIAAFAAGLTYQAVSGPEIAHETMRLAEEVGGVLSAATFFVFGSAVIGAAVVDLDAATVVYAVASLTVVRMLPVAVSMIGSGASVRTMAFAGWFGPRGLATIVFALTIVEESDLPGVNLIVQVAFVTVVASVFAHGLTAPWLTDRYVSGSSPEDRGEDELVGAGGVDDGISHRPRWPRRRVPHA